MDSCSSVEVRKWLIIRGIGRNSSRGRGVILDAISLH